jgi:hypothetical protein
MNRALPILVAALFAQGCVGNAETEGGTDDALSTTAASVNGARISPLTTFADSGGSPWTLKSGVVYKAGVKAGTTSGVTTLLYLNGHVYAEAGSKWTEYASGGWSSVADPRVPSPSGANVTTAVIIDGNKNVWALSGGHVYENGTLAGTTAKVIDLLYVGGRLYQENSFHNFYEWSGSSWPQAAPPIAPPAAKSASYGTLELNSTFTDLSSIDLANTQESGFDWYPTCYFCSVTPGSAFSIVKDGGVTALQMSGEGKGASLYGLLKGKNGVVGKGFSDGAYFEARIAMSEPENGASNWPSFWALPNLDDSSLAWPGHTDGYDDSVELDFMELMPMSTTSYLSKTEPTIGSTLHNWYGVYNGTCAPKHFCQTASAVHLSESSTTSFVSASSSAPNYFTLGALWVPSKKQANGSYSQGRMQFYLNDVAYGAATTWTGPVSESTETPATPWAFAAIDLHQYGLILDTGGNAFMNVQWVHVWQ